MDTANNTSRRERKQQENRIQTLNAIINAILETGREPTIDEITAKSTVSRRTLFNYFKDKDKLISEMNQVMTERIQNFITLPLVPAESFEEQLAIELNARIKVYEYVTPIRRIVEVKRQNSPLINENLKHNQASDWERMDRMFSIWLDNRLDGKSVIRILRCCLSWSNWNFMRTEMDLTVQISRELIERQILAVYRAGGKS